MDLDQRLHCPTCGYNLRGLPDGACPECGGRFERATLARMERPTVSTAAIRLFVFVWPAIYVCLIAPFVGLLSHGVGLVAGLAFDWAMLGWVLGALVYAGLTAAICYPVAKDMARQRARELRLSQDEARPVSERALLLFYGALEYFTILSLSVGVFLILLPR
jgi:hypothetical protein